MQLRTGPVLWQIRAMELSAMGRHRQAVEDYQRLLQWEPDNFLAHVNLMVLFGQLGEDRRARAAYGRARQLNPAHGGLYHAWGMFLAQRKHYSEARTALEESARLNPSSAEVLALLGETLEAIGKPDEAKVRYEQALAVRAGYRPARYNLGRLLLRMRRYGESAAHLQRLLEPEDRDTPVVMYDLATAYWEMGDRERAHHFWKEALPRSVARGPDDLPHRISRRLKVLESTRPAAQSGSK